jgi:hypothetical protein
MACHAAQGTAGVPCPVPHALVCPVLASFGGCKCDADMESVLHMVLDALALELLQRQGKPTGFE